MGDFEGSGRRSRSSVSCEEVRPDRDRERGDRGGRDGGRGPEPNKLFIGQLSFEAEENDIRDKFERYGEIASVRIIKDNATGKSKGFGFIEFQEVADAEKVLRTMDGAEIAGRRCKLDRAGAGKGGGGGGGDHRGGGRYDRDGGRGGRDDRRGGGGDRRDGGREKLSEPDKLFIGKLSLEATEDDIHDAFKKLGDISVQIIKDRDNGESKGFGFIKFQDAAHADEALRTMQGADVAGQPCRLERAGQKGPGARGGGGRDGSMSRSPSRQRRPARGASRSRSPRGRPPPRDDWDGRADHRRRGHPRGRDEWEAGGGGRGPREREHRGQRRERADSRDSRPVEREPRGGGGGGGGGGGRERQRRSRTPDGLPRKSEAINAARAAYEDSFRSVQMARKELDSAEAALKKMQKTADHAVDRKVTEGTERIRQDTEDKLSDMKTKAKNALALSLDDTELQLRLEMMGKIAEIKEAYARKVADEHARIKKEHGDEAEDAQSKVQEDADAQIQKLRKKAEEEENPWEWREARDKAAGFLQKEEDRLQSARRRLETLTGQPVKEPRSQPPRQERGNRDGGKRAPPPPPQGRRGSEGYDQEEEDEEYSYSEEEYYEDDHNQAEGRKTQGRPAARGNYQGRY